ncbi:hypothetical protein BDR03DRAFT_998827 [Suillus americanus]|nr:hypothetical protein BDR03DRAFT_998827 [Suillus americanus]
MHYSPTKLSCSGHQTYQNIARILDREETIRLFNLYTLLSSSTSTPNQDPLINAVIIEDEEIASTETDPTLAWVSNVNPAAQLHLQGPRPVRNHFLKGIISDNARIAFNVTVKADRSCLDASQLQSLYNLPDFAHALHLYATCNGCTLPDHVSFNTWLKFRIQLHSAFHTCRIMPSQQIHAEPPSSNFPGGNCDAMLFSQRVDGDNDIYIQHFDFIVPGPEPSTGRVIRRGSIIPLTDVTHAVEIIPVYQGPLGKDVNSGNSLEVFDDYFLNNFADKELYHSLLRSYQSESDPYIINTKKSMEWITCKPILRLLRLYYSQHFPTQSTPKCNPFPEPCDMEKQQFVDLEKVEGLIPELEEEEILSSNDDDLEVLVVILNWTLLSAGIMGLCYLIQFSALRPGSLVNADVPTHEPQTPSLRYTLTRAFLLVCALLDLSTALLIVLSKIFMHRIAPMPTWFIQLLKSLWWTPILVQYAIWIPLLVLYWLF